MLSVHRDTKTYCYLLKVWRQIVLNLEFYQVKLLFWESAQWMHFRNSRTWKDLGINCHTMYSITCSVAQLYQTLCNPMDCSTSGFPVLHYLPEFAQAHVHWISDAIQSSRPLLSPSPPVFYLSQRQGLFSESALQFRWPKYGALASASAAVLPMNIQGWFSLGLIGLISLKSKGLSGVFHSTTIRKHQFFSTHPSWSNSSIHTWLLEKS